MSIPVDAADAAVTTGVAVARGILSKSDPIHSSAGNHGNICWQHSALLAKNLSEFKWGGGSSNLQLGLPSLMSAQYSVDAVDSLAAAA